MHQSTGRFRHKLPCGVSGCTEFHSESFCIFLLIYSSYVTFTSVIVLCKHFLCSFVVWHTCAHHDVLVLKAYDQLPSETDTTAYHTLKCNSHRPEPPCVTRMSATPRCCQARPQTPRSRTEHSGRENIFPCSAKRHIPNRRKSSHETRPGTQTKRIMHCGRRDSTYIHRKNLTVGLLLLTYPYHLISFVHYCSMIA
jgi:hypothetical protein